MGTVDDGGAGMLNTGVPSSFLEHPSTSRKDDEGQDAACWGTLKLLGAPQHRQVRKNARAVDAVGTVHESWAGMLNAGVLSSFLEHPSTSRSRRMLRMVMLWGC